MNRDELREKIRAAAVRFTEEVSGVFGEAFASVAAEFTPGQAVPEAKPALAPPAPTPPSKRPVGRPRKVDIAQTPAPTGTPQGAKRRGRPPGPGKIAKETQDRRRNRRSSNELVRLGSDILNLLTTSQSKMRVEEINRRLGTATRQIMRPVQKLIDSGQVKKEGERRATVYYV